VRIDSISPNNFGGTYTFAGGAGPGLDADDQVIPGGGTAAISSLERYRRTLLFQSQHLSAATIRSLGGGATQFSIAGGNPEAAVHQMDFSLYAQDDWKLRPNFTISPGLRYENQTNISSNWNLAPRFGFAWSPSFGSRKKAPAALEPKATANTAATKSATATPATTVAATPAGTSKPAAATAPGPPKTVIRGGVGIFYNRISEDLRLSALRFNGLNQQQFVVTDPAVLDLYPVIPQISSLAAFAQPQTRRYVFNPYLAPSASLRSSFTIEQQLPYGFKLTVGYSHSHTLRNQRTVNINAPLAGTYNPALPLSGVRPQGQSAGNILEYQANGKSINDSLGISLNGSWKKKLNFWGSYNWSKNRSSDNGTSGSATNPYDFSGEWGPSNWDIRHFFYGSADYRTASGFGVNTFVIGTSPNAFNITTGKDTNGDTFFTERPSFATDLSKPGVVVTPIGAFDPNPTAGQQIIPRNFGRGRSVVSVNMGVSQTLKFGHAIPPRNPPAPATVTNVNSSKPPAKQVIQRPYSVVFSLQASNVLNRSNRGNPVGNMASPFFLRSTATSSQFFFGPGGSGGASGNRTLSLRVRFTF
jgi:hypothetical protein